MSFGIAAMAHVLGDPVPVAAAAPQYTTDLEKIRSWGYQTLHRAAAGTGLTDLAVAAGHRALEQAGMSAADLDLVVLAMSDIAEYLYWDAAAATQARLGARHAEALLLNQACGSGVASFDAVAGKLATHPDYRTALIIAANRVCEPYWNRMETITSVSSDGAVAAVAVRGHPSCQWLTTTILTDGRYADFMRLKVGGTARPFTGGGQRVAAVASPFDRLDGFFDGDVREMLRFTEMVSARSREAVERACQQAGVKLSAVKRVIYLNDNIKVLTTMASEFGISPEATNADLAMAYGHLGCADQLFCLERYLAAGDLQPDDIVALSGTGSGMHWACTLLRI